MNKCVMRGTEDYCRGHASLGPRRSGGGANGGGGSAPPSERLGPRLGTCIRIAERVCSMFGSPFEYLASCPLFTGHRKSLLSAKSYTNTNLGKYYIFFHTKCMLKRLW